MNGNNNSNNIIFIHINVAITIFIQIPKTLPYFLNLTWINFDIHKNQI